MKLLYLALSFFTLIVLDFYLKSNISGIDRGSLNLPFLGLFVVFGSVLFLWRASTGQSILIRRSTLFLLLFFTYFIFRIVVDIEEMERLKAYTFGSTGGVVLFYIVGTFVAIVIGQHEKNAYEVKNYYNYFSLFFISYLMMSCYLLLSIFLEISSRLRMDIFLIENHKGSSDGYQRPGDFLIISYLILITLYAQFISLRQTRRSLSWIRLTSVIVFTVFVIYSLTSLLVAQMIGSNKATILIAGLAVIVVMILMLLWFKSARNYLTLVPITFKLIIFSKLSLRLIFFAVLGIAILIGIIFTTTSYLDIDLIKTRLGGFGSEISSVSHRLDLLSNFTIQFKYSPFFGHMNVDCLTTGCGSYVHSVFATLLTHTGLLGFFLFGFYLLSVIKEAFKVNASLQDEIFITSNIYKLFTVLFFLAILALGAIGTFLTWSVLWFAFGLILTAVKFKGSYEK
jgi:hypothetical protein